LRLPIPPPRHRTEKDSGNRIQGISLAKLFPGVCFHYIFSGVFFKGFFRPTFSLEKRGRFAILRTKE
jgi:hypothetical protein